MRGRARTARRLAIASLLALALLAAGVVGGGDNPAHRSRPRVTLPFRGPRTRGRGSGTPGGGGPGAAGGGGPARLPGGATPRVGDATHPTLTRAWTVRPLDPAASQASWQAGRLLAYGGTWDAEAQRQRGVGLTLYGAENSPPRHLLGTQAVEEARLHGDLVYALVDSGGELWARAVVSLRGGRVVASSEEPLPNLLLDDRGQAC